METIIGVIIIINHHLNDEQCDEPQNMGTVLYILIKELHRF
jgi:hypothetical protein